LIISRIGKKTLKGSKLNNPG